MRQRSELTAEIQELTQKIKTLLAAKGDRKELQALLEERNRLTDQWCRLRFTANPTQTSRAEGAPEEQKNLTSKTGCTGF